MSKPPPRASDDSLAAGLVLKPVKTSPTPLRSPKRSPSLLKRFVTFVGTTTLLLGAVTLVSASLWVSAVLILRPHPPRWLAAYLPGGAQGWGEMPIQTLAEIAAELPSQCALGDLVDLAVASDDDQLRDLKLLPIVETRSPCTQNCQAIVELRLYGLHHRDQQHTEHLQLLHPLTIQGPTEAEVLKPLSPSDGGTVGSTYQLPLAALKPLDEPSLPGRWMTLTGRWQTQGSPVLFGQLLYIHPQNLRIYSLLNWQSPPGRLPAWHNLDGVGLPELLVNQSYGLEPHFKLYSVSNLNAINATPHLREVSLSPLNLPAGLPEKRYRNALFLAQRGLWSDAQKDLDNLKPQAAARWSSDLEQQRQLVTLHARFSQIQADRDWSQPSQKLLALLLDGRWKAALDIVKLPQSSHARAVLPLLERDSLRIWQRLTATLKVNPEQQEAKLWGALLLMAKEDQAAALKWLMPTPNTALKNEFDKIAQAVVPRDPPVLTTVTASTAKPAATASPSVPTPTAARLSGLYGTATRLGPVNPADWPSLKRPDEFTLPPGHQWYAVTLEAGYVHQQWQRQLVTPQNQSPAAIASFFQSLGLNSDYALQLTGLPSSQPASQVRVIGVQWQGNTVTLLASGPAAPTSEPLIATLPGGWGGLSSLPSQSLLALFQQQPGISDRLIPTLNSHLGFDPVTLTATLKQQANGTAVLATVRWVNLVDDGDREILLTIAPELATYLGLGEANQTAITLILTTQGELLYSSQWSGSSQKLMGWVSPTAGFPALVTLEGDRLSLVTWSTQQRRFQ